MKNIRNLTINFVTTFIFLYYCIAKQLVCVIYEAINNIKNTSNESRGNQKCHLQYEKVRYAYLRVLQFEYLKICVVIILLPILIISAIWTSNEPLYFFTIVVCIIAILLVQVIEPISQYYKEREKPRLIMSSVVNFSAVVFIIIYLFSRQFELGIFICTLLIVSIMIDIIALKNENPLNCILLTAFIVYLGIWM